MNLLWTVNVGRFTDKTQINDSRLGIHISRQFTSISFKLHNYLRTLALIFTFLNQAEISTITSLLITAFTVTIWIPDTRIPDFVVAGFQMAWVHRPFENWTIREPDTFGPFENPDESGIQMVTVLVIKFSKRAKLLTKYKGS